MLQQLLAGRPFIAGLPSPEDEIAFRIGSLDIRWYGILIMLGVIAGAYLAATLARRKRENPDYLWNMVPIVVFVAIAGARLYWDFLSWQTCCAADWRQAFNIRSGGISIHGAIAFGLLAIWLFCRFQHLDFFRWIDIIVPGMALGQAIGRWGNYTNQELFGPPTDLPWGIYIKPEKRPLAYADASYFHPTFFYESLYNLIAALALTWLVLRIDRDRRLRNGDSLWIYLIGYALARFSIETIRTDSLYYGPFKAAHLASLLVLAAGVIGLVVRHIGSSGTEDAVPAPAAAAATTDTAPVVKTATAPVALSGQETASMESAATPVATNDVATQETPEIVTTDAPAAGTPAEMEGQETADSPSSAAAERVAASEAEAPADEADETVTPVSVADTAAKAAAEPVTEAETVAATAMAPPDDDDDPLTLPAESTPPESVHSRGAPETAPARRDS